MRPDDLNERFRAREIAHADRPESRSDTSKGRSLGLRALLVVAVVATVLATCRSAKALSSYASFADIPFGIKRADARDYLDARGYKFATTDYFTNADEFQGEVDGELAYIYVKFDADGGLSDIFVSFLEVQTKADDTLKRLCNALKAKHGAPDGGDCKDYTYWYQPNQSSKVEVGYSDAANKDFEMVSINYEGPTFKTSKSDL